MMKRMLALLLTLALMIPATFTALADDGAQEEPANETAVTENAPAEEEKTETPAAETTEEAPAANENANQDAEPVTVESKDKADSDFAAKGALENVADGSVPSEGSEGGSESGSTAGGSEGGSTEGGSEGGSTEGGSEGGSSEGGSSEGGSTEGGSESGSSESGSASESTETETKPITTVTTNKGRILKIGMSGDDVLAAQKRLHELYYYNAKMDGKFGTALAGAVRNFQSKNGLYADGKIGPKTLAKLNSSSAIDKYEGLEPASVLKVGDHGSKVKDLQRALRENYYYAGTIDGIFGPVVENAVKAFQASTGLKVDGKAGYKTQDALYNKTASIFNGGIPQRALSSGMRGYDVWVLQQKLASLGYLTKAFKTGYFDGATVTALANFQKANKITADGKMGSIVRRYLWPVSVTKEDEDANADKGTYDDPYVEPTIQQGSSGKLVANAQMRLKAAGFLLGNADGVFGPVTKKAVLKLQKTYGLEEDGIIGEVTWAVIKALSVENAEQYIYGDGKTSVGASTTKLYRGSRGNAVRKLQAELDYLGYDLGEKGVDGKFGPDTAKALKEFQKAAGITQDGIAGTQTFAAINEKLGIQWDIPVG